MVFENAVHVLSLIFHAIKYYVVFLLFLHINLKTIKYRLHLHLACCVFVYI